MKKSSVRAMLIVFASSVTIILSCMLLNLINNRVPYENSYKLSEHWTMQINDTLYEDVNLDTMQFEPVNRGDIVTLSTIVPDGGYESPVLSFLLYHAAYELFVDDSMILSYSMDELKARKMIGSGYNCVALPRDVYGKELTLKIYFNEFNAQSSIESPIMCEAKEYYLYFISAKAPFLCIGLFLVVFGLCLAVVSLLLLFVTNDSIMLVYTGIFSMAVGLWLLCNKGVIQILSSNRIVNMWLEYYSLYLAPIPILLFMIALRKDVKEKWLIIPMKIIMYADAFLAVVSLILHQMEICHFPNLLIGFHLVDAAAILFFTVTSIYIQARTKKHEERVILLGIVALAICFGIDIAVFNAAKYIDATIGGAVGISSWGSIFFILSMLFSYGLRVYRSMSYRIEQATLLNLAYSDQLTGLSNRAKFMQVLGEAEKEEAGYTVIDFDLNYLKTNNDTFGHQCGDAMLISFANTLTNAFMDAAIVARVGGDEFYILYKKCDREVAENALERYESELKAFNSQEHQFFLEAAWGIAYSDEQPNTKQDMIIKLADDRMYKMKAIMHQKSDI